MCWLVGESVSCNSLPLSLWVIFHMLHSSTFLPSLLTFSCLFYLVFRSPGWLRLPSHARRKSKEASKIKARRSTCRPSNKGPVSRGQTHQEKKSLVDSPNIHPPKVERIGSLHDERLDLIRDRDFLAPRRLLRVGVMPLRLNAPKLTLDRLKCRLRDRLNRRLRFEVLVGLKRRVRIDSTGRHRLFLAAILSLELAVATLALLLLVLKKTGRTLSD